MDDALIKYCNGPGVSGTTQIAGGWKKGRVFSKWFYYIKDCVNNPSYRFRITQRKPIKSLERLRHTLRYKDIRKPTVTYSFLGMIRLGVEPIDSVIII